MSKIKKPKRLVTVEDLVTALKANGYTIEKSSRKLYDWYAISGRSIQGGFCTEHNMDAGLNSSVDWLNGKVVVDHKKCFDKWSKCPMMIPIPKTQKELDHIIERIQFWGTKEGYKASNGFDTEKWDNPNWND